MEETNLKEILRVLNDRFEGRLKPHSVAAALSEPLASVWPGGPEDVQYLAEVAQRYSVPLAVRGAGIALEADPPGGILIRFDLMRNTYVPGSEKDYWAEAEPGALWLVLDNELRLRGKGLAVYPTSAPRATVGGWLATDGIGVGSFEYGRLRENVLYASVVLPGGELQEVSGESLGEVVGQGGKAGIIVSARLRTRRATTDTPFAVAFDHIEQLLESVEDITEVALPLWHLALLNPAMSRARGLGKNYLLFGAYPSEREEVVRWLDRLPEDCECRVLGAAETYRVWGQRFFPVAPSFPTPRAVREFVSPPQLPERLSVWENRPTQATFSRSGEVLILSLEEGEGTQPARAAGTP